MAPAEYPIDPAEDLPAVEAAWGAFAIVPRSLARDPRPEVRTAKLVLLALASYAGPARTAFPGLDRIAADVGVDRRTVERALSVAERHGYLRRVPRYRPDGGRASSLYVLLDPAASPAREPGPPGAGTGDPPGPGAGVSSTRVTRTKDQESREKPDGSSLDVRDLPETPGRIAAESLCNALADSVAARGVRRPSVTRAWLDAARLLVDRDGARPEEIRRMIEWVEHDSFWQANVLSMPKLRERWATLVLQRRRSRPARPGSLAEMHEQTRDSLGDWLREEA